MLGVPVLKISVGYFVFVGMLFSATPSLALPDKTPACAQAKYDVAVEITKEGGWFIESSGLNKDPSNPFPGSYSLWFALTPYRGYPAASSFTEGHRQAAFRFLEKSNLQAHANKLINSCPSLSNVAFGISNSGYWVQFYKFPDGTVRPKVCLAAPTDSEGWGYGYCT